MEWANRAREAYWVKTFSKDVITEGKHAGKNDRPVRVAKGGLGSRRQRGLHRKLHQRRLEQQQIKRRDLARYAALISCLSTT